MITCYLLGLLVVMVFYVVDRCFWVVAMWFLLCSCVVVILLVVE